MNINKKIIGLLFFFAVGVSCQKDGAEVFESVTSNETQLEANGFQLSQTSLKESPLIGKQIKINDHKKRFKWNQKNSDDFPYWINPSHILALQDSVGNKTYSIELKTKVWEPKHLYNLIVVERIDKKEIKPFIIDYELTNGNKDLLMSGNISLKDVKTNIYSLNSFKNNIGNLTAIDDQINPCYTSGPSSSQDDPNLTSTGGESNTSDSSEGTTSGSYSWVPLPEGVLVVTKKTGTAEGGELLDGTVAFPEDESYYTSVEKGETTDCPEGFETLVVVNMEDKIDYEQLDEREKCIYENLTKFGNNFVQDILSKFEGDSNFSVIISSKDIVIGSSENEVNASTQQIAYGLIAIDISSSKAISRPTLSVARTILHELIHAKMLNSLQTDNILSEDPEFYNVFTAYRNKYPNMGMNELQHLTMSEIYINSMAEALERFHKYALPDEYMYIHENEYFNEKYYQALAWEGLMQYEDRMSIQLPKETKEELNNLLAASINYFSLTKQCNNYEN